MVTFSHELERCEVVLERAQAALAITHAKTEKALAEILGRAQAALAITHAKTEKALAEILGRARADLAEEMERISGRTG